MERPWLSSLGWSSTRDQTFFRSLSDITGAQRFSQRCKLFYFHFCWKKFLCSNNKLPSPLRLISFAMYILGFVWFVLSLVKKYYLRQVTFTFPLSLSQAILYYRDNQMSTHFASVLPLCVDPCCSSMRRHPKLPHHPEHVWGPHMVHHAHHDGDHQRHHGLHVRLHDGSDPSDPAESKEDVGRLHWRRVGHSCYESWPRTLHVSGSWKRFF